LDKEEDMRLYELALIGFNPDTNATDHLIKWIRAPDLVAVTLFLRQNAIQGHICTIPEGKRYAKLEDGVDIVLDNNGKVVDKARTANPEYWRDLSYEAMQDEYTPTAPPLEYPGRPAEPPT
jgi:hypothetical protein